jgi:hypothetical protein
MEGIPLGGETSGTLLALSTGGMMGVDEGCERSLSGVVYEVVEVRAEMRR